jgi:hypothetical protein
MLKTLTLVLFLLHMRMFESKEYSFDKLRNKETFKPFNIEKIEYFFQNFKTVS